MKSKKTFAFCALLSRMKYINRWGLMRAARSESLSEHTAEAAIVVHSLALIACEILGQTDVRPQQLVVAALYHDASEILTGDLPTPVKYKNEQLKTAYKNLEIESAQQLASLAPPPLQAILAPLLCGQGLSAGEKLLLKAADRLCALIKCIEEEAAGNTEFMCAKAQQILLLEEMNCPAANYFILHMLPCYKSNLDELTR